MGYKLPKILIAVPTYEGKNYCLDAFLKNVYNFTYPKDRLDIYIADNSKTNANAKMIKKKYGIKTFWKDYGNRYVFDKMADTHNQLRRYFLASDCDYMLHLESDIFPPKDILEQLLFQRKPIVNGLYMIFDGAWRTPCIAIHPQTHWTHKHFVFPATLDSSWHDFVDGTCKETLIAGIGCCLMKRKVAKDFEFRYDPNDLNKPPDTFFAMDLKNHGVKNYVHTGALCFHYNREDWGRHVEYMDYLKIEE